MGKPTGFMEIARQEDPLRSSGERTGDFRDLHDRLPEADRRRQAERCMNCGVPYCQSDYGCPLHNLIPEWNDLLFRGDEKTALERLMKTAPFPEFTGHVCPALCEKACMMAETDGATTNKDNELYLIEKGFREGWVKPRIPVKRTGKRVAVVGSGPAGLAVAQRLNRLGHNVTVFERADRPGGLLMYGIPNMKLPKEKVERRIRLMKEEGIRFLTGREGTPEETADFDAVVLCGGARKPRSLRVPGEDSDRVHYAVDYLTEATKALAEGREPSVSAAGKHVIVVGGGDTGNDCVGTALRQGCLSVTELEMMPRPADHRSAKNPWPEWPRIMKTDYGQEEAADRYGADPRLYETTVKEILPESREAVIASVAPDAQGRLGPVPGTEKTLPCDLLLVAAGFVGSDPETAKAWDLALSPRGVPAEVKGHSLGGKLFAAGDLRTGQSLVVRALADGLAAAEEVHAYLNPET